MDINKLVEQGRATHGGSKEHHGDVIDFSANINPYPLPQEVREVYVEAFQTLGKYPDESYPELRHAIADFSDSCPENVVPTNGASEGLRLVSSVLIDDGDLVAVQTPGFSEYRREAKIHGGKTTNFESITELKNAKSVPDVVFVCNPNNPTGKLVPKEEVLEVAENLESRGSYLVVDEAFIDLCEKRDNSIIGEFPNNTVVIHSLTKSFALPGLRLGYVVARGQLHDAIDIARPTWNVNSVAEEVGKNVVNHTDFVEDCVKRISKERQRLTEYFGEYVVGKPSANFLLLSFPRSSKSIVEDLLQKDILVRDASTFEGLDDGHIRIAVRTRSENDMLVDAFDNLTLTP